MTHTLQGFVELGCENKCMVASSGSSLRRLSLSALAALACGCQSCVRPAALAQIVTETNNGSALGARVPRMVPPALTIRP
jgi:hypothetical protein